MVAGSGASIVFQKYLLIVIEAMIFLVLEPGICIIRKLLVVGLKYLHLWLILIDLPSPEAVTHVYNYVYLKCVDGASHSSALFLRKQN